MPDHTPAPRNLWSQHSAEAGWKWGTALSFVLIHTAALFYGVRNTPLVLITWDWTSDLDVSHQMALLVPLLALFIFWRLHVNDEKNAKIRGLRTRMKADGLDHSDYAASSISRLSIHSTLATGVIWGISRIPELWTKPFRSDQIVAWLSVVCLGLAVLLGLVSVLCYTHANRRTNSKGSSPAEQQALSTKVGLLKKAGVMDQLSFYALTVGLIWTVALFSPWLSVAANFLLGLLLWIYYFDFDLTKPLVTEADRAVAAPAAEPKTGA